MGDVPPAQWVPASQAAHTDGDVAVPGTVCTVPAAHALDARHVDWFGEDVYVPSSHGAHCRSATALPGVLV
ncbi:MAG: hypothetical protein KF764_25635 [Labilithrix sp.]|nr:hypothetical protein [Labilithrix sp.]